MVVPKPDANNKKSPHRWKPGCPSPNPKGRPKDGESWAAIWTEVTNLSPDQIAQALGGDNDIGRAYRMMPKGVQMKYLMALRVMAAVMFEPNAALLNSIQERMDGKVADSLQVGGQLNIEGIDAVIEKAYGKYKSKG